MSSFFLYHLVQHLEKGVTVGGLMELQHLAPPKRQFTAPYFHSTTDLAKRLILKRKAVGIAAAVNGRGVYSTCLYPAPKSMGGFT
jgi:hypothetical protein